MCWNESISLNTFLFSGFVILLITYNNAFTKYKIESLNNIYLLLFSISVVSIQLVEFFVWRNINNVYYNHLFSIVEASIIFIQPVLSIMIITKKTLRNTLLFLYLLLSIPYAIYTINTKNIKTIVTEKGHLQWNFVSIRGTKVPPETPSFRNGIYIVFDINRLVNIKLFSLREGFQGVGTERRFPDPDLMRCNP
jgi:hypothetical protein